MPSPLELKETGLALYRAEKYAEAAEKFAEAARVSEQNGEAGLAAELRNNQCVALMALNQWAAALAAVEQTPAVFNTLGDRLREAQALANLAAAHDGAGHVDQAAALYEQAVDLFGELGETETRAACFKKLSALQIKQGKQLQALASMHSGLALSPQLTAKEKTLKSMLDKAMKMLGKGG
jgi:tetratricopeptide (TPR) repeat protein